jgi:hypothetical protein
LFKRNLTVVRGRCCRVAHTISGAIWANSELKSGQRSFEMDRLRLDAAAGPVHPSSREGRTLRAFESLQLLFHSAQFVASASRQG